MGQLFGRMCRVTIATPVKTPGDYNHVTTDVIEVGGGDDPYTPALRVQFKASKSNEKEPNKAEITITNLSPRTRASLQAKGVKVTLEAGYEETGLSRIFYGDARTIDHVREGADWATKIKIADGERSYRHARASESFAPGTGAGDVLKYLAGRTGLAMGNIPSEVANILVTFDQGYTVQGPVARSLDRLCKSIGYKWSIQDGALQVLRPGSSLKAAIPLISPSSGLIGSPESGSPEKKGKPTLIKFKCLLQPLIPSGQVHLQSDRYDGFVRLKKIEFSGDTHGADWFSECQGVLVGA